MKNALFWDIKVKFIPHRKHRDVGGGITLRWTFKR
jgi:hypothetical protein